MNQAQPDQFAADDPNIIQIPISLICSREISDGAKSLFGCIKYWQGIEPNSRLSKQDLAFDLHVGPPTITRQLKELQLAGYIIRHPQIGYASIYEIVDAPIEAQKRQAERLGVERIPRVNKPNGSYIQRFGKRLRKRDGNTCAYCGIDLLVRTEANRSMPVLDDKTQRRMYGMMATVDHVTPRSNGGTNDLDNLVLCCMKCNVKKSNRYTYEEFRAMTAGEGT